MLKDLFKMCICNSILFFFSTQGRYGKGTGQEYLKFFMVEYKRPGIHAEWRLYTDKNSHQVSFLKKK